MKNALIITGGYINFNAIDLSAKNFSTIIAADSGYLSAEKLGIAPSIIVGDFDSASVPSSNAEIITAPKEKDETDTMLACNIAIERGATELLILGGTGGRADHFLANVFLLEALKDKGISVTLTDGDNAIRILNNEETQIPNNSSYFSVFALDFCSISLKGCKYPLENYKLTRKNPFAVSNEVIGSHATISVIGKVILCESKK